MMALMMTAWLLLAQAEAVPDTPAETEHAAALEALDWLQGCWEGEGMGGTTSECWSRAASGELVGAFQYSRDGVLQFSEMVMIGEAGGVFGYHVKHFNRDFTGWEEPDEQVSFAFVSADESGAEFSGLVLERDSETAFTARLRMRDAEGEVEVVPFTFHRPE